MVHYQLLYGSTLSYKIAGKVAGSSLLTGSFELKSPDATLTNLHYAIDQIQFAAFVTNSISGTGLLDVINGIPSAALDLVISDVSTQSIPFTNVAIAPDRKWPMIALRLQQTNAVNDRVYTINIRAAPFHDIWISSATAFRADALPLPDNQISAGDLLSVTGRIVKRGVELSGNINNGLDAIAFYPTAGIAFSCDGSAGISDGDIVLPNSTRIHYTDIFTNALATAMPDPGIDGLQFTAETSFYFSVKHDTTYSAGAGKTVSLRDADIWWTDLQTHELVLARSREQIFAYPDYQPWLADPTVGIDAFYIWPSGEVWFSLRASWTAHTAIYSTDGYGAFTDTFAVDAFKPSIDPGLDALLVITDLVEPRSDRPILEIPGASPNLKWSAAAHAYQLEASANVEGPYFLASPVIIDSNWPNLSSSNAAARFYRVRQW